MIKFSVINFLWKIKNFFLSFFPRTILGARALVIQDDKILLVKHTYTPGWYTVGGGVDRGESSLQALIRELNEEVGITPKKDPVFFGFYYNPKGKQDDHVALYVCKDFERKEVTSPEILDSQWFPLHNLPPDVSDGTRRRIEEYLKEIPLRERW